MRIKMAKNFNHEFSPEQTRPVLIIKEPSDLRQGVQVDALLFYRQALLYPVQRRHLVKVKKAKNLSLFGNEKSQG